MSVKYTVTNQGQIIGTRKSAGHREPIYTHAVVRVAKGHPGKVLSYCSRRELANAEAGRRARGLVEAVIIVMPVEAVVTTRKAPEF